MIGLTGDPLVSVLIATKDRLPWLTLCLASARRQTHSRLEIIVSDDGSSDATIEYVRSVAAADDRVQLLVDNPVPGVFQNFAHLLERATGDAVCLVGDDDILGPEFIEELLTGLRQPSVGVAYAGFDVIGGDGASRPQAAALFERHHGFAEFSAGLQPDGRMIALRGQMWLGACLYRTELIKRLGFDLSCGSAADWDLALRAADVARIWRVPRPLWAYRDHGLTVSRSQEAQGLRAAIGVLRRRTYEESALERLRRALLQSYLLRAAWREVALHPSRAREDLRAYRATSGTRGAPRYLILALLTRVPAPMRRTLVRIVNATRSAWPSRGRTVEVSL